MRKRSWTSTEKTNKKPAISGLFSDDVYHYFVARNKKTHLNGSHLHQIGCSQDTYDNNAQFHKLPRFQPFQPYQAFSQGD